MTTMQEKAAREFEIGRAVRSERARCTTIAESFVHDARTDGEAHIAQRIAEVIRSGPITRGALGE